MADLAGHDINYISVAGVLGALGDADRPPPPPLNLVGDFGGGGMFLAVGVLAALQGRSRTGRGDVLDVSMLEGASYLLGPIASIVARGGWSSQRHSNGLDGGAPFYGAHECADGRFVSIGPLEPQFYARLLAGLGLDDIDVSRQWDRSTWPELRRRITGAFLSRPRDHWAEVFVAIDACVAPVLALDELTTFPHVRERGSWVEIDGVDQPTPTPRFERSTIPTPTPAPRPGAHTQEILAELGLDDLGGG
jgi:alpha-methylacyl-CoA racemase